MNEKNDRAPPTRSRGDLICKNLFLGTLPFYSRCEGSLGLELWLGVTIWKLGLEPGSSERASVPSL